MADNVQITAGSGTTVATDDVAVNGGASAHVQYVKLVDGRSNGADGTPADTNGLWVRPRYDLVKIQATSSGLTTASTAYSAGDQVGGQMTLSGAARVSGGTGMIRAVILDSAADIIGAYDVVFARESISLASDNAAFAISDADELKTHAVVQLSQAFDLGNNRKAQALNLAIPYDCAATDLFAGLITRAGHTFFGATSDLQLTVWVERN